MRILPHHFRCQSYVMPIAALRWQDILKHGRGIMVPMALWKDVDSFVLTDVITALGRSRTFRSDEANGHARLLRLPHGCASSVAGIVVLGVSFGNVHLGPRAAREGWQLEALVNCICLNAGRTKARSSYYRIIQVAVDARSTLGPTPRIAQVSWRRRRQRAIYLSNSASLTPRAESFATRQAWRPTTQTLGDPERLGITINKKPPY